VSSTGVVWVLTYADGWVVSMAWIPTVDVAGNP